MQLLKSNLLTIMLCGWLAFRFLLKYKTLDLEFLWISGTEKSLHRII